MSMFIIDKYNVKVNSQQIDGVGDWMWVHADTVAWDSGTHYPKFKELYLEYVKHFRVAVQAGGNCGMYPRLMANLFDTVYTFEPDSYNFHCLVNNCQTDKIIKINAGLGERNHVPSSLSDVDRHNTGTMVINDQPGRIPVLALDDFNLHHCDLIHLDIEGYEIHALRGAEQTIRRCGTQLIAVERNNDEIRQFLTPLGYEEVGCYHADTFYKKV